MKKILIIILSFCFLFAFSMSNVYGENRDTITNDFINDYNYYIEHYDEYLKSNWNYRYGDIDMNYDMSYFAPQRSFVGTEAYCEISNGILHPGTNEMVLIVWTAPHSGKLTFSATSNKLYHDNGDGSAMLIYDNSLTMIDEENMPLGDSSLKTFSDSYNIKRGEKIYFVLDYIGNNWSDSTVFDIKIELSEIKNSTNHSSNGCK